MMILLNGITNMRKIELHGKHGTGRYALASDEDYVRLSQFRWLGTATGYAIMAGRPGVLMHRLVAPLTDAGQVVDHRNGLRLDNQRKNLRVCSRTENTRFQGLSRNNTTGYKGVSVRRGRYCASITINRKFRHLGSFDTAEQAAHAYNVAAVEHFGAYALTNDLPS